MNLRDVHNNILLSLGTWQLYDLGNDPLELYDLFTLSKGEQQARVNGPFKTAYSKNNGNLWKAAEDYFVSYVKEEIAKEYSLGISSFRNQRTV